MRLTVPTGQRLTIPTDKRLTVRHSDLPPITHGLLFTPPLVTDAKYIYGGGGGVDATDPDVESVDSVGWYIDPATGLITQAQTGVLSIEKDGGLLGGERENEALNNENLQAETWNLFRASVIANQAVAPTGQLTADFLKEDGTTSSTHGIQNRYYSIVSGTKYVRSIFVKANGRDEFRLSVHTGVAANCHAFFNLITGTVGTIWAGADDAGIKYYGNGWYRCWITYTATSTTIYHFMQVALVVATEDFLYNGDNASGMYIWRDQHEEGTFPSRSILTVGAAVTCAADQLAYASAGHLTGGSPFSIVLAVCPGFASSVFTSGVVTVFDSRNAASNWGARIRWSSLNRWEFLVRNATTTVANILIGSSFNAEDVIVLIGTAETDNFNFYENGTPGAPDSNGSLPAAHAQIVVGNDATFVTPFYGNIARVMIYNRSLSSAESTTLTNWVRSKMGLQ